VAITSARTIGFGSTWRLDLCCPHRCASRPSEGVRQLGLYFGAGEARAAWLRRLVVGFAVEGIVGEAAGRSKSGDEADDQGFGIHGLGSLG
jgi:hypothetical protein